MSSKPSRLKFSFPRFSFYAALLPRRNPETVKTVLENLPLQGFAELWGEEIYFSVDFDIPQERGATIVAAGDIGFWPPGPAIAIFFGKTPASRGEKPEAASAVNVFACVENLKEFLGHLKDVQPDTLIRVSKVK